MELNAMLRRIDENREEISGWFLSLDEERGLDRYHRIGTTYASNALEGNTLTLTETKVLLEDGITAGGKLIRDVYEATGHAKAYDFMLKTARAGGLEYTENTILELHRLFYSGVDSEQAGRYRTRQVFLTNTGYVPPPVKDVSEMMAALVEELNRLKDTLHPVLLAAFAHRRLVDIHPFTDGNGRTARLLMNLVLVNKEYCIISIPPLQRREYRWALAAAQRKDNPTDLLFQTLIAECELEAQRNYGRMLHIPLPKPEKDGPER